MTCNAKSISCLVFSLLTLAATPAVTFAGRIYEGTWLNIDPNTTGITRADVSTGMFTTTVEVYASCLPQDCYWGQQISTATSSPFAVTYYDKIATRQLRFDFVSYQSLHIHTVYHYSDGRPDVENDFYFYHAGSRPDPLPDLVINQVSVDNSVVVQGASVWTWAHFTTENIGPGIQDVYEIRAVVSQKLRNGQPQFATGYMNVDCPLPFNPGDFTQNKFAVGENPTSWPIGSYALTIQIDTLDQVAEYNENNNLSPVLRFDVLQERYLSGKFLCNGVPVTGGDTGLVPRFYVSDYNTGNLITGYDSWYDNETGHYYLSNLPDIKLRITAWLMPPGREVGMAGDYRYAGVADMPAISSTDAMNYNLDTLAVIHLTQPRDNAWIDPNMMAHYHCGRIDFQWDPMPGADHYNVTINQYRDSNNPGGFGLIQTIYQGDQTDTDLSMKFMLSNPDEFYGFLLDAYNSANEQIGTYMVRGDGYSYIYRAYTIGSSRLAGDINGDCNVNMVDLALLFQDWLQTSLTP